MNNGLIFKENSTLKDCPLSEYPRVNLVRNSYLSLNGNREICITNNGDWVEESKLNCVVPFAIETNLSGVAHLLEPIERIHYKKHVILPKEFRNDLLIIHFEGIDCISKVFIDQKLVKEHVGGYTSFEVVLEDFKDEFDIDVIVEDKTDESPYSRGKQKLNRGGIWYTSTSGIYKPVWIESVSKNYIKTLQISPLFNENAVKFDIKTNEKEEVNIEFDKYKIKGFTNEIIKVDVKDLPIWSLDNPNLITVKVKTKHDEVESYFGFRDIKIAKREGIPYIFLNNEPVFINGLLDQGYYYEGNLTPKDYSDYLDDITEVKALGFNCIRVHIKTELPMFYYYCDANGILVIQDIVNGGDKYKFWPQVRGGLFPFLKKNNDKNYKKFSRTSLEGKKEYYDVLNETINNLYNHPSVIMYTLFNEGWGQFDSKEVYEKAKEIDPNRIYDVTSGWYDNGYNEIESIHSYFYKLKLPKNLQKPVIFTEFGGYSYFLEDHFYGKKKTGYRFYNNKEKLTKAYEKLYRKNIIRLKKKGLAGAIYTQLNDVEDEINGLMTFDRKVLKINRDVIKEINKELK